MDQKKIFFSYAREDASEFALKLAHDLRNAGANIWIDQLDILPSQRWDTEIQKALFASECVLFLATVASINSDNVLDEVNYALNNKKKVYPILVSKCDLPYRTSRLQNIDFISNYDKGLIALLKALNLNASTGKVTNEVKPIGEKIELSISKPENVRVEKPINESNPNPFANDSPYIKGTKAYDIGLYEGAIVHLSNSIRLNSEHADSYLLRGNAKNALRQYNEAIDDYTKVIELDPKYFAGYRNRAMARITIGLYDEAINDCSKAISIVPDYIDGYNDRGRAKYALGHYEEAIADYNKVIELDPEHFLGFNNLGLAKMALGRLVEAIEDFNKVLTLNPEYFDAYNNRGIANYRLRNYKEAGEDYNKTLAFQPNHSLAYYNRGILRIDLGNNNGARQDYKKSCELGYNPACIEYDKLKKS